MARKYRILAPIIGLLLLLAGCGGDDANDAGGESPAGTAAAAAAILGHVDNKTGPDAFYRLRELSQGDKITVTAKGGKKLVFVVYRIEQHVKKKFPTEKVWLPTAKSELRLITCGGEFNRNRDSYRDNIIAFASLQQR